MKRENHRYHIRLTKRQENSHQWRVGDSGTGKTMLLFQDLLYAEQIGRTCVVVDHEAELIRKFWKKGHYILNPGDQECVFWDLKKEVVDLATAQVVAGCLVHRTSGGREDRNDIFYKWAKELLAVILNLQRPSTLELSELLSDISQVQKLIKDTAWSGLLPKQQNEQYAGIEGALSLIATTLAMMPDSPRGRQSFCVREYLKDPKQWVWITSESDTREPMVPFYTAMMDLILRGLLKSTTPKELAVYCTELNLAGYVGSLPEAYTNMRKRGVSVVSDMQNAEQGERIYGKHWKTMFSQASTKWLFATSEEVSAKGLSELTGKRRKITVEESRSIGGGKDGKEQISYRRRMEEEPIANPSEIMGMSDLSAYFIRRGFNDSLIAIPVTIPVQELPDRRAGIIPRLIPPPRFFSKDPVQKRATVLPPLPPPLVSPAAQVIAAMPAPIPPVEHIADQPGYKGTETFRQNQKLFGK